MDGQELISADAVDILFAEGIKEDGGRALDEEIPGLMPLFIVGLLEVIDIAEEEREFLIASFL